MGERKGQNKYYPPDYDPRAGGLNKWQGTHALRERARKIDKGIIIIRFEMPYNIWCEGCNNHIGMGVRYNSEKTKVGMYYTTPVYEFKMKCHLCDNHFVIKTDPGNLDYVILSGARRQENRWDPIKNEQIVPETKEIQKRLFDDSMFKLEHGTQDQDTAESEKPRLIKIYNRNDSLWNDNYSANARLRQIFRQNTSELKSAFTQDQDLLRKSCLSIPLLPEREEDRKLASLLTKKLTHTVNLDKSIELKRKDIINSSSLPTTAFTPAKERRALKLLRGGDTTKNLVVLKRKSEGSGSNSEVLENNGGESDKSLEIAGTSINGSSSGSGECDTKKIKLSSSLVDYGDTSESE